MTEHLTVKESFISEGQKLIASGRADRDTLNEVYKYLKTMNNAKYIQWDELAECVAVPMFEEPMHVVEWRLVSYGSHLHRWKIYVGWITTKNYSATFKHMEVLIELL